MRARVTVSLVLTLLAAVAGLWLQAARSNPLVLGSYDVLHALGRRWLEAPATAPVLVVYLDADSHAALGQDPAGRWDRSLHARLIDRLTQAGARAIVFDVIFDRPGTNAVADRDLAAAIRASGRVVLAGELVQSSHEPGATPGTRTQSLALPDPPFRTAAAGWGLANLSPDADFTVRRHFGGFDPESRPSLTWAAAKFLGLKAGGRHRALRWLRYYGPPLALPHVSYRHALDPLAVADEVFRGRIVFVGARPVTGAYSERRDEFRSPFPVWAGDLFLPAVEVHATQMLNLLGQEWLERLPPGIEAGVLCAVAALLGFGLTRLRPLPAAVAGLGAAAGMTAASVLAFVWAGVWFPWLIGCAVQLPLAFSGTVLARSVEWYRARRRLEAERQAAAARIREQATLIDKAQDAILVLDLDNRIVYANPGAGRLYGRLPRQLAGGGYTVDVLSQDVGRLDEARCAVRERGEWSGEFETPAHAGQGAVVESRWTLIRDEANRPKSILVINTDITERKRIEAQFLRTQRLEAVGAMAGGMAHDLNNALAPVLLGIQRLRGQVAGEDAQHVLSVMEANTRRGAEMVRQVLAFSRGRGDRRELLNPGQLLFELERFAAQTFPPAIRVATLVPRDLWPVFGNATQLHQVLMNLCVNARDAMPNGGEITLAADNVELGAAEAGEIPEAEPGAYVMLLVADTGTGIPPEVRARLFEPFFTTKPAGLGTGLGLATIARIIRGHHGFLNLRTEVGAGTTFEVYLPRAAAEVQAPGTVAPAELRGGGECVLVIEDESALREMLSATLEEHGYCVLGAGTGVDGLATWQRHERTVRVALLDLNLPEMDGATVLTALRKQRGDLPVVLMSAASAPPPPAEGPPPVFLAKPFTVDRLLVVLRDVLRRNGG